MRSQLSARKPPSSTSNSRRSSSSAPNKSTSKPKKNKYANFSKADDLSMDPLDAMINESRTKLRELHREEDSKTSRRRQGRKRSSSGELTSLEAVDHLLSTVDGIIEEVEAESVEEKRDRNKRSFPDTKAIDPYDPTTYGYIELGTIIGAHGVHGLMKLTSITDFSQHRLCQPGTRHIKLPNRRSPREVKLLDGRPLRPNAANIGGSGGTAEAINPTYLIQLENVDDREEALKMRGCVLYALEEETVDDLLEEGEYIVSDLIGLNVFLDENTEEHDGSGFDDLFVGNIRGVVMGSEMCAVPGLGQDLLEVALPKKRSDGGGGEGGDLVLVPFVPEIVSRVDLNGRMISIIPPKGLLDLSYRREEKVRIKGLLPPARNV
eukprot:CAMPEP_0181133152 /NCGR_PEP_ID=MMETSP1071-20121207/31378_1 /TAXON_ID=35127 /ORGANISM="Thalassiosira sp., Strain NH16" /LENGTH=377 /DNA_ID=CAMNT_0023219537 /DNA_START=158 /DNA_END=1291 /DNA_ORIENTATION=-